MTHRCQREGRIKTFQTCYTEIIVAAKKAFVQLAAEVELAPARTEGGLTLEACLRARRSCRNFKSEPLTLGDASQLLWAAQGVTGLGGLRTAPSAGATFAIRTYLVAMDVETLSPGVYLYDPDAHALKQRKEGQLRSILREACCDQEEADFASAAIVLSASTQKLKREFGDRGIILGFIECGHIGQNICLQAASLGLGALTFGKTNCGGLKSAIDLPITEEPCYVILAGPKF